MLKGLCHFDGISWASLDTQITHGTQFEVVDKCIDRFFLFPFGRHIKFGDDFDGSVRASQFAGRTTGAGMFIIFIIAFR